MDLVERYLGAIASQLPDEQRADVTAELRDLLMSEVEDKEAQLGRPLERAELEALLKGVGHPLVVAGRYRKFNQLIGPEVFPFYWFTLRVVLTVVVVGHVLLGGVLMAGSDAPGQVFGQTLARLVSALVATLGWVTVGFVVVERTAAVKSLHRWSVASLPAVAKPYKSRFEIAVEIAFTVVFIAWWMDWTSWTVLSSFGKGEVYFTGGPMREALHWPVLGLAVVGLGVSAVELVRPGWNRLNAILGFAWNLWALVLLGLYLSGGDLLQAHGALSPERLADAERGVNLGLRIGLGVLGVFLAWEAAKAGWWLARGRGDGPPLSRRASRGPGRGSWP